MLKFENVSISCQRTPILSDINFSIHKGEITTVIGPNGCGKTTLLQSLNGSSKVTAGKIILDGEDYLSLTSRKRAQKLAFLPQVRTVIPTLPVKTLVEHGRFPYLGFSRKKNAEDVAIVQKAMEFTHVDAYADQYVDTLSGGLRQRVFFAMILAQDSDLLVFDEPTTYLDLEGQRTFYQMLVHLKQEGKTILLVLHDLAQAVTISDQLLLMDQRKMIYQGTPKKCLESGLLEQVFHVTHKQFEDNGQSYHFFQ